MFFYSLIRLKALISINLLKIHHYFYFVVENTIIYITLFESCIFIKLKWKNNKKTILMCIIFRNVININ